MVDRLEQLFSMLDDQARSRYRRIEYFDELDSTNSYCGRLIRQNRCVDGLVVWAGKQNAGRGRLGRRWESPEGNLYVSIARQSDDLARDAVITLLAGLSAAQAVEAFTHGKVRPNLKWPNDLVINSKKLGGILVEGYVGWQVIGIGINVNCDAKQLPQPVRNTAICLKELTGEQMNVAGLLAVLLSRFSLLEAQLKEGGGFRKAEYLRFWADRGKEVVVILPNERIQGTAVDITEDGQLVVLTADGKTKKFMCGEVIHARAAGAGN